MFNELWIAAILAAGVVSYVYYTFRMHRNAEIEKMGDLSIAELEEQTPIEVLEENKDE